MVKLKAILHIRTSGGLSSRDPKLYKSIELPFTPFIGLGIWDDNIEIDNIENLVWIPTANSFETHMEDKQIPNAQPYNASDERIHEIVNEYIQDGWIFETE